MPTNANLDGAQLSKAELRAQYAELRQGIIDDRDQLLVDRDALDAALVELQAEHEALADVLTAVQDAANLNQIKVALRDAIQSNRRTIVTSRDMLQVARRQQVSYRNALQREMRTLRILRDS
jgi:hypothetical protein